MDWSGDMVGTLVAAKYVEALRLAMEERRTGLNEYMPLQDSILAGDFPILGWNTAPFLGYFQFEMDNLIPRYVNHHDEADWADSADGPVRWTSDSLMAHLGQTRIRPGPAGSGDWTARPFSAAWLKQQYDMLNELVWAWRGTTPQPWGGNVLDNPPTLGEMITPHFAYGNDPSWATAKTDAETRFAAASPQTPFGQRAGKYAHGRFSPGIYSAQLNAVRNSYRVSCSRDFHCILAYYYFAAAPSVDPVPDDILADGLGDVSINLWNYAGDITSVKSPGGDRYVWSPNIGNLTVPPWYSGTPSVGNVRGWQAGIGSGAEGLNAVLKYDQDATDGFQFVG